MSRRTIEAPPSFRRIAGIRPYVSGVYNPAISMVDRKYSTRMSCLSHSAEYCSMRLPACRRSAAAAAAQVMPPIAPCGDSTLSSRRIPPRRPYTAMSGSVHASSVDASARDRGNTADQCRMLSRLGDKLKTETAGSAGSKRCSHMACTVPPAASRGMTDTQCST